MCKSSSEIKLPPEECKQQICDKEYLKTNERQEIISQNYKEERKFKGGWIC